MKVLVQWTKADPENWFEFDSSIIENVSLIAKPEPTGNDTIDNNPGWIYSLNIQGVIFTGYDHYSIEHVSSGQIKCIVWNDDEEDWPEGQKHAQEWTFNELAPDINLGNAINTNQSRVVYAQSGILHKFTSIPTENTIVEDWDEFVVPSNFVIHGIWVNDTLASGHNITRSLRGWREWTEHLPADEVDASGFLKPQRQQGRYLKAKGTITYFQRNINQFTDLHDGSSERKLVHSPLPTGFTEGASMTADSMITRVFTTEPGEPGLAQWPDGDYRAQFDCIAAEADIEYGVKPLPASIGVDGSGHFARVDSDHTVHVNSEFKLQDQDTFTGTGLKLATASGISWGPGSADDRFEVVLAARNTSLHGGSQAFSIVINESDHFVDGPWVSGIANNLFLLT
jgi:hypothetical protein